MAPGDLKDCTREIVFVSLNVTSVRANAAALLERVAGEGQPPTVVALQEHSLAVANQAAMKGYFKREGVSSLFGPPDPQTAKPSGGVGAMAPSGLKLAPLGGLSPECERFRVLGRLQAFLFDPGV
eukprot:13323935-Alexandrium_andersonii.AAC.1